MDDNRREPRTPAALPVTIRGIDRLGSLFTLCVQTVDVTGTGARLGGLMSRLETGANVAVQHNGAKAMFRVVWVGQVGTPLEGQIGVQSLQPEKRLWQAPLMTFCLAASHGNALPASLLQPCAAEENPVTM